MYVPIKEKQSAFGYWLKEVLRTNWYLSLRTMA